jgi:hypothetical protein
MLIFKPDMLGAIGKINDIVNLLTSTKVNTFIRQQKNMRGIFYILKFTFCCFIFIIEFGQFSDFYKKKTNTIILVILESILMLRSILRFTNLCWHILSNSSKDSHLTKRNFFLPELNFSLLSTVSF